MNQTTPAAEPTIREIPLSRLALAAENVRKTPPDPAAQAELVASIKAHGLLENLVVRPEASAADATDRYAVVAGGRRLAALIALADEGSINARHPVPCKIVVEGDQRELSLAENTVRIAMHPADQVVAFAALSNTGSTVAAIAARFGVSERTVEQRLRLGGAAPEILDAYRAGNIDLDVLQAFTVTTDRERQIAAWEQVSDQGYRPSAWQVKRLLTEERIPGASTIARFVGVQAYEAAGGPVMRDLFARDDDTGVWFEDPALLQRLAIDKLQVAADECATRWKWAVPMIDVEWQELARYGRIEPQRSDPTPEEQREIDTLEARQATLAELDEHEWTEASITESETIESRLEEISAAIDARATWQPEDFAIGGCIVTPAQDGSLQVIAGLVKPEDIPKPAETAPANSPGQHTDHSDTTPSPAGRLSVPTVSSPTASPPDPEATARREAGVSIGLAEDLRHIRTALVKTHLTTDFTAAFDLMLFQMARSIFTPAYTPSALDVTFRETADRPHTRTNDETFAAWSPAEATLADVSHLSFDWMQTEDDAESFAALRILPESDKQALFAACVARTIKPQLAFEHGARPELEATVARLDIDFAAHVRPTADMLWSRIKKSRILDIARETVGAAWVSARSKYKKPDLAKSMEEAFAAGATPVGVTASQHAAALAWTMPGFAPFDTGTYDGASTATTIPADTPADTATASHEAKPADAVPTDAPAPCEPVAAPADAHTDNPATRPAPTAGDEGHSPNAPPAGTDHTAPGDAEHHPDPKPATDNTTTPEARPAPTIADAIDAANAVPTADGGPRVIVQTVDPVNGSDALPPIPTGDDAEDVPAFLHRVH